MGGAPGDVETTGWPVRWDESSECVLKAKEKSVLECSGVKPRPTWPGFKGLEKGLTRKLIHRRNRNLGIMGEATYELIQVTKLHLSAPISFPFAGIHNCL